MKNKIKRTLAFPYGYLWAIGISIAFLSIYYQIFSDAKKLVQLLPPVAFFLLLCVFVTVINFYTPKCGKEDIKVYIMLYPSETVELDKFIENDIAKTINMSNERNVIKYITPGFFNRCTFNFFIDKIQKKGKNALDSKYVKLFLRWTRANAVLFGNIYERKEEEAKYVLDLRLIYQCDLKNDDIRKFAEGCVNMVFSPKIYISQQKEISGMIELGNYIKAIMVFILGVTKLSILDVESAFNIHFNLFKNEDRSIFFKNTEFNMVLEQEIGLLYAKNFVRNNCDEAKKYLDALQEIDEDKAKTTIAQFLMWQTKNKKEMHQNAGKCMKMLSGKRDVVNMASKAYLYMILGNYKKSEEYYSKIFKIVNGKKEHSNFMLSLKMYCDMAVLKDYEAVYAHYLKGLINELYYQDMATAKSEYEEVVIKAAKKDELYYNAKKRIESIEKQQL